MKSVLIRRTLLILLLNFVCAQARADVEFDSGQPGDSQWEGMQDTLESLAPHQLDQERMVQTYNAAQSYEVQGLKTEDLKNEDEQQDNQENDEEGEDQGDDDKLSPQASTDLAPLVSRFGEVKTKEADQKRFQLAELSSTQKAAFGKLQDLYEKSKRNSKDRDLDYQYKKAFSAHMETNRELYQMTRKLEVLDQETELLREWSSSGGLSAQVLHSKKEESLKQKKELSKRIEELQLEIEEEYRALYALPVSSRLKAKIDKVIQLSETAFELEKKQDALKVQSKLSQELLMRAERSDLTTSEGIRTALSENNWEKMEEKQEILKVVSSAARLLRDWSRRYSFNTPNFCETCAVDSPQVRKVDMDDLLRIEKKQASAMRDKRNGELLVAFQEYRQLYDKFAVQLLKKQQQNSTSELDLDLILQEQELRSRRSSLRALQSQVRMAEGQLEAYEKLEAMRAQTPEDLLGWVKGEETNISGNETKIKKLRMQIREIQAQNRDLRKRSVNSLDRAPMDHEIEELRLKNAGLKIRVEAVRIFRSLVLGKIAIIDPNWYVIPMAPFRESVEWAMTYEPTVGEMSGQGQGMMMGGGGFGAYSGGYSSGMKGF